MDPFAYPGLASYELLDSGRGEKLERVGPYVLRRPDPQALWRPQLDSTEWQQADYKFERESDRGGYWHRKTNSLPSHWSCRPTIWCFESNPRRLSTLVFSLNRRRTGSG